MNPRKITDEELSHILSEKFVNHFWARVKIGGPDECWPWSGYCDYGGYGALRTAVRKTMKSHRIAWIVKNQKAIPEGLDILHSCIASRSCCNPSHLRPGTDLENVDEARKQGRLVKAKGEDHWKHKMTAESVLKMRELHEAGAHSQRDLGRMFNVSQAEVWYVVRRKTWKDV